MAPRVSSAEQTGFDPGETIIIRPSISLPDWDLVPNPLGRTALAASIAIAGRREKWSSISAAEDRVWRAVLRGFAGQGRAPTAADLIAAIGCTNDEVNELMRTLSRRDLLVLDLAGTITAAYPFSATPTSQCVTISNATSPAYALCAIDALGIGGMMGADSTIVSECPICGTAITITTRGDGLHIASVEPAGSVVWSGIHYAAGCAATSGCAVKLFFCSDAHLTDWRAQTGEVNGFRLFIPVALQVALALFVPMLAGVSDTSP
jgi:hypothetical protein